MLWGCAEVVEMKLNNDHSDNFRNCETTSAAASLPFIRLIRAIRRPFSADRSRSLPGGSSVRREKKSTDITNKTNTKRNDRCHDCRKLSGCCSINNPPSLLPSPRPWRLGGSSYLLPVNTLLVNTLPAPASSRWPLAYGVNSTGVCVGGASGLVADIACLRYSNNSRLSMYRSRFLSPRPENASAVA